jgi:succinyl-CoA synthetase beta subunit
LLKSRRWISLHEYQSKKILQENNLNVQRFQVVDNPQDAKRAGEELSLFSLLNFSCINKQFLL